VVFRLAWWRSTERVGPVGFPPVRLAAVRALRLGWSTLLAAAIQSSIDGSARRVSRDQLLRIIYRIAAPRRMFGNC